MVAGTVFEKLLGRKRDLSVDNLGHYAAFIPPRRPLKKRKRIPPKTVPLSPTSPPSLPRTSRICGFSDALQQVHTVSPEHGRQYQELQHPTLSFEMERRSISSSRRTPHKEHPTKVMKALLALMKKTEKSRNKLFLERRSFPKEILETSDRLLHRNTTRKKLIWVFSELCASSQEDSTPSTATKRSGASESSSRCTSPHNSPSRSVTSKQSSAASSSSSSSSPGSSTPKKTPLRPTLRPILTSKKSPSRSDSTPSPGRVSFAPRPCSPSPSNCSHPSPSRVSCGSSASSSSDQSANSGSVRKGCGDVPRSVHAPSKC